MYLLDLQEGGSLKPLEQKSLQLFSPYIEHLKKELLKIRTGRAHPCMIEDIKVVCYGSTMSLKELAAIAAPESQLLTVQPWDISLLNDIERALATSDLGVTPQIDGKIIRLILPKMSSDRRQELTKVVGKRAEEAKIGLRKIRQDLLAFIKDSEKQKQISQDYAKRVQDGITKVFDDTIKEVEQLVSKKEADITAL